MIRTALALGALWLAPVAMAQDADRVTMSLDEFLALYEKSKKDDASDPEPPAAFARSAMDVRASVELGDDGQAQAVVFDARIRADVLKQDGWVSIPLVPSDAALMDATVNGRPAPVRREEGWYRLTTDTRGAVDVRVTFAVAVKHQQGIASVSVPWLAGSANTMTLSMPDDAPVAMNISSARRVSERVAGGKRVFEVSLAAVDRLAMSWQAERGGASEEARDARVYAEVSTLVSVGEGVLKADVSVDHTVLFAGVDAFRLSVPVDMTVLSVLGAGVADWSLGSDGTLGVDMGYEVTGDHRLRIALEKVIGQADQRVAAPVVKPMGVERVKGWIGVAASGNLEVASGEVKDASAVDIRGLPADILGVTNQPMLLGYKYLASDPEVALQLSHHDEVDVLVTLVDVASATTMLTEDGRRLTQVRYEVRNNHKQYLALDLPDEAELWSAAVAARAIQPARAEDGKILIPLPRSSSEGTALSSFQVEVVYVETGEAPENGALRLEVDMPRVDVPVTTVNWTLFVPEQAKVSKRMDGSLRAVDFLSSHVMSRESMIVHEASHMIQQAAEVDMRRGGGTAPGAAPVRVALPLTGQELYFEKLLALDERLWVGLSVKKMR